MGARAETAKRTDAGQVPPGVGILGLGRIGAHHLEQCLLRNTLRVAAAWDSQGRASAWTQDVGVRYAHSQEELLADREVELVIVAVPLDERVETAIAAIGAGKHVVIESPVCRSVAEFDRFCRAAEATDCLVDVFAPRRTDLDFLRAETAVRSDGFGRLTFAQTIAWGDAVADDDSGGHALYGAGAHALDQLLQLVKDRPVDVSTRSVAGTATDVTCVVTFAGGAVGVVEVAARSCVPIETGWMLRGSEGGYRDGRLFTREQDGEIVETEVELDEEPADPYAAWIRSVRYGRAPHTIPVAARDVVGILEACGRTL